ncbi:hypothetical protein K438DRAFT_1838537 [Mycena galopus ATCC 62051]|nr:hypothetical protein K438DRAFT_1838537 [Mycena galopus ATCC 62051]
MATFPHLDSINASPRVLKVLSDLHAKQPQRAHIELSEPRRIASYRQVRRARHGQMRARVPLLRGTGARYLWVSTIYLALAVGQNAAAAGGSGKVIATEQEASKAARAREHWALAGSEVEPWIELREGDLRETLKQDLPAQVDFLFLDIWTPMALPTLKLVHPHLKKGAIIVVDNVEVAKDGYRELLEYIGKPENGIKATSIPFSGGLGFYVYLG